MYIFGITGPTGAGKSTISESFRRLGVYVSDADQAARAVVEKGMPCLVELTKAFGDGILNSDGSLNRKALAGIVFSDDKKLDLLNSITHIYIKKYILKELEASGSGLCAIDGAVIIGSPVMELCRRLVLVTADREVRLSRIMQRDSITYEAAELRIAAQMSDEEYRGHADYIIENNGNLGLNDKSGEQIEQIYSTIKNEAESLSAS